MERGPLGFPRPFRKFRLVNHQSPEQLDRVRRRLDRIEHIRKIRVHNLDNGASIDFRMFAPPEVDTPTPERGPNALRSVFVFDRENRFQSLTLRYPSVKVERYGSREQVRRMFDKTVRPALPGEARTYVQVMVDNAICHLKTQDLSEQDRLQNTEAPEGTLDDWLDFIAHTLPAFNRRFFDVE